MADLTDVIFVTSRDDLVNTKFLCSESLFIFWFGMDCHFVLRFVDGMDLSFLMSVQCKQLFLDVRSCLSSFFLLSLFLKYDPSCCCNVHVGMWSLVLKTELICLFQRPG